MAFVAPFRGLRFNPGKVERLEDVMSPPYDVINSRGQAALLAKHPYNMIQLDISKEPGGAEGAPAARYEQARDCFGRWQEEEVLLRDPEPAIYLYDIDYVHPSGRRYTRRGLVALIRLADFAENIVKPHEQTFATVTRDRLKLMDTCQAQFSQIFSLYADPAGAVMATLDAASPETPLLRVRDGEGNIHSLRAVTDRAALARVHRLFADQPLYIADGHHRYTTALQFRDMIRERYGKLADDNPINYTMMYLCAMEDPGLSVLPTHRLLRLAGAATMDAMIDLLAPGFDIEEVGGGAREVLVGEVLARIEEESEAGEGHATVLGLYHAGEDRCLLLKMRPGAMDWAAERRPPELRDLDVVVLSDLVLEKILGVDHEQCERENLIGYFSDPDEALDVAVKESTAADDRTPLLFLLNRTAVHQVRRVADAGLIMPHKSTFFYPKILTGLIMNKFVPSESVTIG